MSLLVRVTVCCPLCLPHTDPTSVSIYRYQCRQYSHVSGLTRLIGVIMIPDRPIITSLRGVVFLVLKLRYELATLLFVNLLLRQCAPSILLLSMFASKLLMQGLFFRLTLQSFGVQ